MTKRPTAAIGNAMKAAMFVPQDDDMGMAPTVEASEFAAPETIKKPDARNLHKTDRTEQFATRLKQATKDKMYEIVKREKAAGQPRFTLAELIELAVDAYERERGNE